MSPLASPLLALAAAAHRAAPIAHRFNNHDNCKHILTERRYSTPVDPSAKLTVTYSITHSPSTEGLMVDITDYCSTIVTPSDMVPQGYLMASQKVTACSSKNSPSLATLADNVFSPVAALCSYRESACEPINLTVIQTCVPRFL